MFKKWKLKCAEKSLNKELQGLERQVHFFNFKTAKHIGIVLLKDQNMSMAIDDLLAFFHTNAIKVDLMIYVPEPAIPSEFLTRNQFVFCKRDLNWCYKPKSREVRQFINTPFDMLIDFTFQKEFPVHYIVSLSRASMKVGRSTYPSNPYDFIVSVSETDQEAFYIDQVKHYLEHILIKK